VVVKIYAFRVTCNHLSMVDPLDVAVLSALRRRRPPNAGGRPREAVVLSGGGSLGAAQIGALRALLEAGIKPDVFVGCSVGALNAAALAIDPTLSRLDEIDAIWRSLDRKDVFGGNRRMLATHLVRGDAHLYEPDALRTLVRRAVPIRDLGDTSVPCHVVTTDLQSGRPCWWTTGDPVVVLSASACLPAVFPPVPMGDSLHVDGGVTCPVPTDRALDLGAMRTWVLDVTGGVMGRRDDRMNALDVLLLSFAITRSHLDAGTGDRPGQRLVRLPRVPLDNHELRDFSKTPMLMDLGYTAMSEVVAKELAAVPLPRRPL
jgi:NTE family protein